MKIKSNILKEFIKEIQYNNRNPQDIRALELLDDISTNPEIVIEVGTSLYRCRVVSQGDEINTEENFYGYNAKESFVPPAKLTKDLRANYKYIPYLYCANDPYIALVEVRPRLGSLVSVATIINQEKIRLLDFTIQKKPSKMSSAKKNLFLDLSILFSTPITDDDNVIDYIPTQYIAEYVKNKGYDGIAFSSSLTPEVNENSPEKYNVVVFNYQKCKAIKSNVFKVKSINIQSEQADNSFEKIDIRSFHEEEMYEIDDALNKIIDIQNSLINAGKL